MAGNSQGLRCINDTPIKNSLSLVQKAAVNWKMCIALSGGGALGLIQYFGEQGVLYV